MGNVLLSPIVSFSSTRLLQCIHRKDDYNERDILYGLKDLTFDFWFKLSSIFIALTILFSVFYFVKKYYRTIYRKKIGLRTQLNILATFMLLFYIRILTRQPTIRRAYNRLNYIRYFVWLVIILFTILHQLLFYVTFVDLKFRNTSYILRDLKQVLVQPGFEPCFLESETVVQSKTNKNSIMYKLYHRKEKVCFLSDIMAKSDESSSLAQSLALNRLLFNILVGSDEYVEYFGYLFCAQYSDFIRTLLKRILNKELNRELPMFWNPSFEGDETLEAFFISKQTSKSVQDSIYSKFVYRTFEHGWIWFLKYIKHKIDGEHQSSECFTSDYNRISFPYRFSKLILINFALIFKFTSIIYASLFVAFLCNCAFKFVQLNLEIKWIRN